MLTLIQVKELAKEEYAVECDEVKRLDGYSSYNYRLYSSLDETFFVMRVVDESGWIPKGASQQVANILTYMHHNGFQVPLVKKSKSNDCRIICDSGNKFGISTPVLINLLTYLPGKSVFENNLIGEQLLQTTYEVGMFLGLFEECLLKYSPSNKPICFREKDLVWFTSHFYLLNEFLDNIEDIELKKIINTALQNFKKKVHPLLPTLRQSYVHGDPSNTNIIIIDNMDSKKSSIKDRYGIIDYEDVHYGPVVFDLTLCMAYMMINGVGSVSDPLLLGGLVLSGYQNILPLTESEVSVVYLGVMARLATSYVMSFTMLRENAENEAYLSVQSSKCPALIKLLWDKGESETVKDWLECNPAS